MGSVTRILYISGGAICVTLGLIGIFIPILPTTPFLLLAAFLFARSSDRALHWLLNNRWFGAYIRNYREGRGMALRDKALTLTLLWITIILSVIYLIDSLWVRLLVVAIASAVTFHLVRINTYRPDRPATRSKKAAEIE